MSEIRMAPTEVGQWNYTITGPTSAFRNASFNCVDSDAKGFIVVNPTIPIRLCMRMAHLSCGKGRHPAGDADSVPYESRFKVTSICAPARL